MPFVLTSGLRKGFEMVSLAVSQRWPVLLYGPAGGGKTSLIFKLAHDYGSRGMWLSSCMNCAAAVVFLKALYLNCFIIKNARSSCEDWKLCHMSWTSPP